MSVWSNPDFRTLLYGNPFCLAEMPWAKPQLGLGHFFQLKVKEAQIKTVNLLFFSHLLTIPKVMILWGQKLKGGCYALRKTKD